jgi:diadenosine tetraphosphate (Ap4A) HIT family hydrolase
MPVATAACSFCRIAAAERPDVIVVGEGQDWLAFFPKRPAALGHTLVVPRQHILDFWQLPTDSISGLLGAAQEVGEAIRLATEAEGLNLITSSGSAAEQTVPHLHLHVLPRWKGDGITIWPERDSTYAADELLRAASEIRRVLRAQP